MKSVWKILPLCFHQSWSESQPFPVALSQSILDDADGEWARQGKPCEELVQQWLNDEYFQIPPPKSTGRELFSPSYLESCWNSAHLSEADFLATLTEFTVASIAENYCQFLPQMPDEVLLCGGGSRNSYLKERLQYRLSEKCQVLTTDDVGYFLYCMACHSKRVPPGTMKSFLRQQDDYKIIIQYVLNNY